MQPNDTAGLLTALADRKRLVVLGALANSINGLTLSELQKVTGLDSKCLHRAVSVLVSKQIVVRQQNNSLAFSPEVLQDTAQLLLTNTLGAQIIAQSPELACYFQSGLLLNVPEKHSAKRILAKTICSILKDIPAFSERELNDILREFYQDPAELRRLLVDMGYMKRASDGSKYELAN